VLELTDDQACEKVVSRVRPWGLVNNAGYMNVGTVADVPPTPRSASSISRSSRRCAAADTVFAVLSDPRAYANFVVGTKRIRYFDPTWPEPGSAFHHTIGTGPVMLRDTTRVVEVEEDRRLVFDAGVGPIGVSRIVFTLEVKAKARPARSSSLNIPARDHWPRSIIGFSTGCSGCATAGCSVG
jgi:hypothetical protein